MICVVAELQIDPEQRDAFERLFSERMDYVRRSERGTLTYQLARSRTAPATYMVMEIYADEAAMKAHTSDPWLQRLSEKMRGFMSAAPKVEYLDGVRREPSR